MRSKLTLNLDDLSVDSFDTSTTRNAKGTVFGEQCTCPTACTCPGCPTCYASCNGTCGDTCAGTCAYTCDDYSCAESCGGGCGAYSDMCNSYDPCPSAQYTNCGNVICY
jgi:hypothetical protein